MIEHTHNLKQWAVIVGRYAIFMERPDMTRQKKYREPICLGHKRCKNKAEALSIKRQFDKQIAQ